MEKLLMIHDVLIVFNRCISWYLVGVFDECNSWVFNVNIDGWDV